MCLTHGINSLSGVYPSCKSVTINSHLSSKMLTGLVHLIRSDCSPEAWRACTTLSKQRTHTCLVISIRSVEKTLSKDCWLILPQYPRKILYATDFFPHQNPEQQAMVNEFVQSLEVLLGVKKTEISIAERWSQCPPGEAGQKSIRDYLDKVFALPRSIELHLRSFCYSLHSTHSILMATILSKTFRRNTKKSMESQLLLGLICAGNGSLILTQSKSLLTMSRDTGAQVTPEQKAKGLGEIEVYKKWFHENILNTDEITGSDAILILPCGSSEPKYRDLPNALVPRPYSPKSFS